MKSWLSALKLILTLKCEQSTKLVSDSLDRELTAVERWAVRLHYIACWSCRRFGKQMRMLRETFNSHADQLDRTKLPPDAVNRIREAIEREH